MIKIVSILFGAASALITVANAYGYQILQKLIKRLVWIFSFRQNSGKGQFLNSLLN